MLQRLGLGVHTMKEKDALFFYQLILLLSDTRKLGVWKDPRQSYYSKVEKWTNIYAAQLVLGGMMTEKLTLSQQAFTA
eukprot:11915527-Ditylum_brightwellii.AAC.1